MLETCSVDIKDICHLFQFSGRMVQAQDTFSSVGLAQDVETARRILQQHHDTKKRKCR